MRQVLRTVGGEHLGDVRIQLGHALADVRRTAHGIGKVGGFVRGAGIIAPLGHLAGLLIRFAAPVLRFLRLRALQQRIALQFGVHEGLKLDVRHLQQPDRLLHLRRHDQGLTLADLQSLTQRHRPVSPSLRHEHGDRRKTPAGRHIITEGPYKP